MERVGPRGSSSGAGGVGFSAGLARSRAGEEPRDRLSAVVLAHATVSAQQVADLGVQAFECAGGAWVP